MICRPDSEEIASADYCDLARRWGVSERVMSALHTAAIQFEAETGRPVRIHSGYRTEAEQEALRARGRPTASDSTSTHRTFPATGADITLGFVPNVTLKHIWGRILRMNGLRMGGGSSLDRDLLPTDWQHVDAGPRGR